MDDLERQVRERICSGTNYRCVSDDEVGISGNVWQIDAIVIGPGDSRVAYIEVKDTWKDANKSTYINHMRRAYARMGDFRQKNIEKAVVVGDRRGFGHKDWEALFESIDCSLIAFDELDSLIERL